MTTAPQPRPWYRKKRYVIPLGLVVLFIVIGMTADPETEPTGTLEQTAPEPDSAPEPEAEESARSTAEIVAGIYERREWEQNEPEEVADEPEPEPAPEPEPKPEPEPEPEPEPDETVAQRNARAMAADYLDYSAFSRSGLIGQLEYEGFSTSDAEYAVDNIEVNWRDQAVRMAEDYLDYSSFSRSGLIDQLEYEGFSTKHAENAANEVGL